MNYKLLLGLALLVVAAAGFGTSKAQAYNQSSLYPPVVQKLVERFGLQESEVQAVFDEARQEHRLQMQARLEAKLNQLAQEGKITEAQKQAILSKHQELQQNRLQHKAEWQNMTSEQKHQAMKDHKQELESWASQNGIDLKLLFGGDGMKRGHGWFK